MIKAQDDYLGIDMERAQAITEMAKDVKEFAVAVATDEGMKPSVMLSGIAVALVELNHDYSKGDDAQKAEAFENMIDVLRLLHEHYGEAKRLHAIREANEARKEGRIQ